jgi:hypothetical protein
MRLIVGVLACVSFGAVSAALADPPAANSTTTPAASAPASTTTAATSTPAADDAQEARHLRAAGYHAEMHNGQKVWCKEDTNLGTRLSSNSTKSCGTAQDVEAMIEQNKQRLQQGLNQSHTASSH